MTKVYVYNNIHIRSENIILILHIFLYKLYGLYKIKSK
nr:MAG TPA: hypothetical protein [Bacteriophage sp.]